MADNTGISWTQATWNPVVGCSILSPGCKNCYAMGEAHRLGHNPALGGKYAGLTTLVKGKAVWNGVVRLHESALDQPLRWQRPRLIFVNSMSDLFHVDLPWPVIDKVFAVMALAKLHIFQVLTKRSDVMEGYINDPMTPSRVNEAMNEIAPAHWRDRELDDAGGWPLKNVWLGVSAEDQPRADERIPALLRTKAAVRWVSAEPLLGDIDFMRWLGYLDWIVVGGESSKDRERARPMRPDWARSIRDQCVESAVPYFFKQWGEWAPGENANSAVTKTEKTASWFNNEWDYGSLTPRQSEETHRDDEPDLYLIGKKAAGDKLDGVQHHNWPAGFTMPGHPAPAAQERA